MRDYSNNKWWKGWPFGSPIWKKNNLIYLPPKTSVTACILLFCIAGSIGMILNLWVDFWDTYALAQVNVPKVRVEKIEIKQKPKLNQGTVREVTAYNLGDPYQNDDSPCIGAYNQNLCELIKAQNICASNAFPKGTKLYIENFGECIVLDKMASRYKYRVDLAFPLGDSRAKKWGTQKLFVKEI